jgi:hypothetical protein
MLYAIQNKNVLYQNFSSIYMSYGLCKFSLNN